MNHGKVPVNELDRAVVAIRKSNSAMPRLMRALGTGELWFTVPYHPEVIGGKMKMENGMQAPFNIFKDAEGDYVRVFSSYQRLREALRAAKVPPNTFAAGSMDSLLLLEVLSKMNLRAGLNVGCKTGMVILPVDMLRDLADGSALRPKQASGERMEGVAKRIDPADYPTDILQPLFEILRQHKEFRAAWVMDMEAQPGDKLPRLQFVIHMEPYVPEAYHDFRIVLANACGKKAEYGEGTVNTTDGEQLAFFWNLAQPFFVAEGAGPPEAE